jgi:hypothetical protein
LAQARSGSPNAIDFMTLVAMSTVGTLAAKLRATGARHGWCYFHALHVWNGAPTTGVCVTGGRHENRLCCRER